MQLHITGWNVLNGTANYFGNVARVSQVVNHRWPLRIF
jgi:hypothetical protein